MSVFDLIKHPITDCFDYSQLVLHGSDFLEIWAFRCARDVESLDETGDAKKCNDATEQFLRGIISRHKLNGVANDTWTNSREIPLFPGVSDTVRSVIKAAIFAAKAAARVSASDAVQAVEYAVNAGLVFRQYKKQLYHSWLIELISNDINELQTA